jgi:hypothetical protein
MPDTQTDQRWMRTSYTLTVFQNADVGNAAILDQSEMHALLIGAFDGENPTNFQSLHIEQGETITQPTEEQGEMRRRCYRALNDAQVNSAGPLLFDFAEDVLIAVDELEEPSEDDADEIADTSVPVYTYDRIKLFTEDIGLATWNPEIPGGDEDSVAEIAGRVLYDLAREIAARAIEERLEGEDEDES